MVTGLFSNNKFVNALRKTKEFLQDYKQNNPRNLIIAKTDKSKQTVVLYEDSYNEAMSRLLDSDDYRPENSDPHKKVVKILKKYTADLKNKGKIDNYQKLHLSPNNTITPRIYGLVKTHKPNVNKDNIVLRPVLVIHFERQ